VHVKLSALRAKHFPADHVEEQQEGVAAVDSLCTHTHDAVHDVDVSNHPLLAFLPVPLDAPVVHVGPIRDGLVLG
jgi:hypothetical protein